MRVFILSAVVLAMMRYSSGAGEISEKHAVQLVRQLPEFIAYAKTREYAFDDNELISDRSALPLPASISLQLGASTCTLSLTM